MFIRAVRRPGKRILDYYVIESYWDRGAQTPRHRVIASLGHCRNVERAYFEAMKNYLKASARLQAFEAILPHFTQGSPQRG